MKTALITGTSSGIGEALAQLFAERGFSVWGVARRHNPRLAHDNIKQIRFDLSDTDHMEQLITQLPTDLSLDYLVHNAATEGALQSLATLPLSDLRRVMRINVEAPFILTQQLLSRLQNAARVLHISSGLAHNALAGTGAYCISKSALHMLYACWNQDLKDDSVLVGSLDPGVVGTAMQDRLRNADSDSFVSLPLFHDMQANDLLQSPVKVAQFIYDCLVNTDNDAFTKTEWARSVEG